MPSVYPSYQTVWAGFLSAVIGVASSFAVVIHGLTHVGATMAEATSGLMALYISMGICAIVVSLALKMPVAMAQSMPGAALLATTGAVAGGFPAAVGAFILCAGLIMLSGLFRPLTRLVSAVPMPLANAMLAGVLFGLCLAPVKSVALAPLEALPVIAVWAIGLRFFPLFSMLLALAVTVILTFTVGTPDQLDRISAFAKLELVPPVFTWQAIVGIALPLYLVTMASQNIPGVAVLAAYKYSPEPGKLFAATGFFSFLSAPFGGHAITLAAITAALCAGEDADPAPERRYWAAVFGGVFYIVLGLFSGLVSAFIMATPDHLITALAGLALIGAFAQAVISATREAATRTPAIITFLVTASGVPIAGVSSAFWGLAAGGAFFALMRFKRPR
ncbi:benzoate/H(+) symporter BenE family transporter [Roseibium sp. RKSG952]|uniref:benzoate/H(+) symporter BenE family transporter n=1 Tax=Roseibium sp. RKSG952 TaxID=2529384 RepID=UPI0012BC46E6|nr:benzoate/H(+) symporter BenE family transporter [Roseibium sp. RKSG952]MTH97536.1 benzoate transporter BenE [Roseibium sp. RKSG952]